MFETVEELNEKLQKTGYFIEPTMTQVAFLAAKMQRPLLLEGPAGSGKTEMDVADQVGGGYNDADIEGVNPMGRFATPQEVARAVLFLADPEQSGFINGQALAVDGGWTSDGSWQSLRESKR